MLYFRALFPFIIISMTLLKVYLIIKMCIRVGKAVSDRELEGQSSVSSFNYQNGCYQTGLQNGLSALLLV